MMHTNLYVTYAGHRQHLELLELLARRGYRFPDGRPLSAGDLPRTRLPYALDTLRRQAARTSAATVGYLMRLRGTEVCPFAALDPGRL